MDSSAQCNLSVECKTTSKSASCSGSESSSTEEEERLRRLFQTCDRDGDGYIDSHDLMVICRQLNMEEAVEEIMQQLGGDDCGRISFDEFVHCRMRLITEIEQEKLRERGLMELSGHKGAATGSNFSWGSGQGDNVLGVRTHADIRNLDVESHNLYKMMESHDAEALQRMIEVADRIQGEQGGCNFLDVANSLHLAALTSLKGEIIDLSNRLQHVTSEKDLLEKQLNKAQTEKLRAQREYEDRLEQQTSRYEERITELHSVIAELRKKIDRHQINVIREEDEFEESDGAQSNRSNDDASVNDNNANESQTPSLADIGNDLNVELSRVVSELEQAIGDHQQQMNLDSPVSPPMPLLAEALHRKSDQVCSEIADLRLTDRHCHLSPHMTLSGHQASMSGPHMSLVGGHLTMTVSSTPSQLMSPPAQGLSPQPSERNLDSDQLASAAHYEAQLIQLQHENGLLKDKVGRQEAEMHRVRAQLGSVREDRDRLKRRVRELQTRVQSLEASTSPLHSRTSTPTKSPSINPTTGEKTVSGSSVTDQVPIAKIKKLRTSTSERQVLGPEISSVGCQNAKVAEHLVRNLQESSSLQEISHSLYQSGNPISEAKIREFEIEFERLNSKIEHLKSQNDLVALTLEESKAHSDRLSVLIGKYESNNTALQLAMNFADQALEAYEVLVTLIEAEKGVLLANCRAAGLGGSVGSGERDQIGPEDQEEMAALLQRAHFTRKSAEHVAKQLIQRLERSCGVPVHSCTASPWEDLSSNSRTASTTSSTASSADTDWSKVDEQKLRDYILSLKNDRSAVKVTVMELESVHIDPFACDDAPNPDAQRLDLENAVLMQELMAMKEEKAELKARNYLLEKEKASVDLQLSSKQSQEQAYLVQIEHLKCELKEVQQRSVKSPSKKEEGTEIYTPSITLAELRSHDTTDMARDLSEAMKREKRLKLRVQELMATLEKLSKNSEVRHQQSAEFVNDLKRANSALVAAFEKAKKKYQGKVKRQEQHMGVLQERYETQILMLKQRISILEEESSRPSANETSL